MTYEAFAISRWGDRVPARGTSDEHSTVCHGKDALFDLGYLAFGIPAEEGFARANGRELKPGRELRVYLAEQDGA